MKVFVTGATGFLGGHLVSRLVSENHHVTCLVRNPDKINSTAWAPKVCLVKGDLSEQEVLQKKINGFDIVFFNLAAIYEIDVSKERKS